MICLHFNFEEISKYTYVYCSSTLFQEFDEFVYHTSTLSLSSVLDSFVYTVFLLVFIFVCSLVQTPRYWNMCHLSCLSPTLPSFLSLYYLAISFCSLFYCFHLDFVLSFDNSFRFIIPIFLSAFYFLFPIFYSFIVGFVKFLL